MRPRILPFKVTEGKRLVVALTPRVRITLIFNDKVSNNLTSIGDISLHHLSDMV